MYSLHDLEVTGIPLEKVLACEIESRIGEHSTFLLTGLAEDADALLYGVSECQEVEILLHGSGGTETLFSGIVTRIRILESGQMKTAQIEGMSRSWLMDRTRHSRSFQDVQMTYQALAQEILKDYEGSSLIYAAQEQPIGSLAVQYEETDWVFLKRVLSQAGLALTPDSRKEGLKLYAGVPAFPEKAVPYELIEMDKDMESYYYLEACGRQVHTADFTRCRIASGQIMGIFETAVIQGQPLAAYMCRYAFDGQEMTGIYGMQSAKGMAVLPSWPMHLIGVALMAKVVNVSKSKIQAAMEIDGSHTQRAVYWFPYSTISASADGSGWYFMPEIGDSVRIYFPSKQEAEAVALSAVNSYDVPQGGRDRMEDPDSRYLRTKYGQELALNAGHIRLSCADDAASLTIQTDGKTIIYGRCEVHALIQEKITIQAGEELSVHAKDLLLLQSKQGGQVIFNNESIRLEGIEVKMD